MVENTANNVAIRSSSTVNISGGIVRNTASGDAISNSSTVNISGGTVSVSGSGRSAINSSSGTVKITGGTLSATQSSGYAVYSESSFVMTYLGGNPTITGRIFAYPEKLEVYTSGADIFAPSSTKTYTLEFPADAVSKIAVMNGRNFLDNFELYNPGWVLTESGANLAIVVAPPCPQITTFPFTEGFENNSTNLPACWTQEYVTGTVNWAIMQTGHSGSQQPNTVHEGSYKAVLYNGSATSQITRLVMPPMNLSGLTNPALTFYHTQQLWNSDQDRLRILYKTSASGAWTQLVEYTNNVNDWTERTIVLPNKSADYYIAFEGETRYGYGVHLDDIRVSDGSTNVSFTATQTGGTSNTANSTGITLTFSQPVTGLTAGNITIANGIGSATKGTTLTGSGTSWTINLTGVTTQGTVTVSVANFGDYNFITTPSVTVYKDITPPTVLSVTPSGTGAAISGNVDITFSEAMSATPVGTVQLNGSTLNVGSWMSSTVYTIPYSGLAYNTTYTVNISGFSDTAGNTMTANNSNSFTTASSTPTTYVVNFSVFGGNGAISATVDGAFITTGASVEAGKNVVFTASPNSNYQVKEWKLNGAVITGNTSNTYTLNSLSAAATVTVEFTADDEPPLQLTMLTPLNNEMDVELTVQVVVTFNKSITTGDFSDKNYFAPYVAVKGVEITSNKLIITTSDNFEPDQTYTVTIPANTVKGYDEVITWQFTTGNSSLTGTELMDILEAKLYPNPVNAGEEFSLQVDMKDDNRLIVEIFTVSGVLLQKTETADPQFRLTAPDAAGVYLLRITGGNTDGTYRLVVQ